MASGHQYGAVEIKCARRRWPPDVLVLTRYLSLSAPAGAAWVRFVVSDIDATLTAVAPAGGQVEVAKHINSELKVVACSPPTRTVI
jgi:hypothetical protein